MAAPPIVARGGPLFRLQTIAALEYLEGAGGGGATDLAYTAATRVLASSTGTDATLPLMSSGDAGLVPASGGGTTNFLRADGTFAAPAGGTSTIVGITGTKAQFDTAVTDGNFQYVGDAPTAHTHVASEITDFATAVAATASVTANTAKVTNATHTGDVTGATALTIADNAVTLAKMADVATARIIGRVTEATGDPEALTGTQATTLLDAFTSSLKGLAPASGGGTANYLRADGTWAAPPAGSDVPYAYGQLTSNYTLTSQTAAQKLFNFSTNGALTLATGRYRFNCKIHLLSMSATSGNGAFGIAGAGTATVSNIMFHVSGFDNTTPLIVGARGGSASINTVGAASMVTAGTGTGLMAEIDGLFNITVAGTIIPSISLVTAAAAIVQSGSYFECIRIGDTGSNTLGSWS